jgi:hypothetical protein
VKAERLNEQRGLFGWLFGVLSVLGDVTGGRWISEDVPALAGRRVSDGRDGIGSELHGRIVTGTTDRTALSRYPGVLQFIGAGWPHRGSSEVASSPNSSSSFS